MQLQQVMQIIFLQDMFHRTQLKLKQDSIEKLDQLLFQKILLCLVKKLDLQTLDLQDQLQIKLMHVIQ